LPKHTIDERGLVMFVSGGVWNWGMDKFKTSVQQSVLDQNGFRQRRVIKPNCATPIHHYSFWEGTSDGPVKF
jgi:hypothetical protein